MERIIFSPCKSLHFFLFFILFTASLTSCKKEDPIGPNELLTGKYWILTAETVNPPFNFYGTLITDWYAQRSPCSKDNLTKFESDGTYIYDEGGEKCSPENPQTTTGRWVWNPDKTKVTVTEGSDSYTYNIVELTGSKLVYTESFTDYQGITYTVTTTMAKR